MLLMSVCTDPQFLSALKIVKIAVGFISIVVPIILILAVMIKLIKVVIEGDNKFKEVLKSCTLQIISAIVVFLVPTMVSLVMSVVSTVNESDSCWNNANDETITSLATSSVQVRLSMLSNLTISEIKDMIKLLDYVEDESLKETAKAQGEAAIATIRQAVEDQITKKEEEAKNEKDTLVTGKFGEYTKLASFTLGWEAGQQYTCNANNGASGYKVVNVGDGKRTTTYGMTESVIGNITGSNCNMSSTYKDYFNISKFVIGACIPIEAVNQGLICVYDEAAAAIKRMFINKCGSYDLKSNELYALIDQYHSGISYTNNVITAYCNVIKNGGSKLEAKEEMFKEWFKKKNANPKCLYVKRRECELNLFLNNDYTCDFYGTNFVYKYKQYHENTYNCQ